MKMEGEVPNLIKFDPVQVGSFLEGLKVRANDDVKLRIKGGVMHASVKRQNGRSQTATTLLDGRFRRVTSYDAANSNPSERRKAVEQLHKEGHRQTAIAEILGVSQATISLDIKKIKAP